MPPAVPTPPSGDEILDVAEPIPVPSAVAPVIDNTDEPITASFSDGSSAALLPTEQNNAPAATERFASGEPLDPAVTWKAAYLPIVARWFLAVWAIGAAALGLRALIGSVLLLRFCRRLRPVCDDALAWSAYLVARRLGMRRTVRLREAAGLTAPMACGIARPIVALPPGFADDYGVEEQQAMLAHELAHLHGIDPLWQRLADWLAVILWWHPAVWWARRQWRAASEAAADEASLVIASGPELLAGCLVALGGRVSGVRPLGWVGMRGGFRSHLGRRVERLLSLGHSRWRPPARLVWMKLAVPALAVAATILGTSWARFETSYQGEANMQMVKHYWRQSLLGVAMLATFPAADQARGDDAPAPGSVEAVAAAPDQEREGDKPRPEGEKRDGDRPREGEKRDGDRPRPEGEKRDGDRPREGEKRDGDRPPLRDKERGDADIDRQIRHLMAAADNLEAAGRREEASRIRREAELLRAGGERPKEGGPRDGDRPREGDRPRDGDRPRFEGDRPREGAPKEGRRPGDGFVRPGDGFVRPGVPGAPGELMEMMRRMQEEIAILRREMAEMRRMLPDRPRDGDGRRPEGRPDFRPDGERKRDVLPDRDPEPKRDRVEPNREREGGERGDATKKDSP
jgi:beta-lactamase regulating signal transducer with metallopeptidase domain